MSRCWALLISAGRGPVEVRRFVADLADALVIRLRQLQIEVTDVTVHGEPTAPGSIRLAAEGPRVAVTGLLGTHVLVQPSRGRRARKRWFVGVSLHEPASLEVAPLDPAEVSLSAIRSRGPGGQHVNARSTAIRAVHRPTRIAVRSEGQRCAAANRRAALARLAEAVAQRRLDEQQRRRRARWRAHDQVIRGQPVCAWGRSHDGVLIEI